MAAARQRVSGGAETHFAKKLASNEKPIRDRAVKKLRVWISSRRSGSSGLSDTDMLKLWKGLFYCMWMSDKPNIQEELAETMAQLLHSFNDTSEAFGFLAGFFRTMFREWHGIDRLRLDKFYLLIRKFIHESIVLLKNHNWDDRNISLFSETLENGPLTATNKSLQMPEGVQSHVIQVYIEELFKVDSSQIQSCVFLKLLKPFSHLLAISNSKVITQVISARIFDELMGKLENGEENGCHIKVDFSALSEQLFAFASRQDIAARNRNILYAYVKKLRTFGETITGGMNANSVDCNNVGEGCAKDHSEPLDNQNEGLAKGSVNDHEEKLVGKEDPVVNGVDNGGDLLDVNNTKTHTKKDETKKTKGKRVRKRKCEDLNEGKTTVGGGHVVSFPGEVVDNEKLAKTKRNKSGKNEIPAEMLENEQKPKLEKGEKKGKKKKSELVAVSSADNEQAAIQNEIPAEMLENEQKPKLEKGEKKGKKRKSELVAVSSADNEQAAIQNEIPAEMLENEQKPKLEKGEKKGKKRKSELVAVSSADNEQAAIQENHAVADDADVLQEESDLLNGSYLGTLPSQRRKLRSFGRKDTSAETRTLEMIESRFSPEEGDQRESRQESDEIADSLPLAMFLRQSLAKTKMNTEPKKTKGRKRSVNVQANSAPGNRRKQVRIELSKNTSHTTKDYRRSLKSSPVVPYDAKKKPVQSSLKSPPIITRTSARKSTRLVLPTPNRASAADFF